MNLTPISQPTNLTTTAKVKTFLGITDDASNARIAALLAPGTAFTEEFYGRGVLSAEYAQWRNGSGSDTLLLPEFPITAVAQLSLGMDVALKVTCEAADASHASVAVTNTGVVCTVSDGEDAGAETLLFAEYETLTLMAAAIEALDGTWDVTIEGDYGGYRSDQLRVMPALFCKDEYADLYIPDDPENDFVYDGDSGQLILGSGTFPRGRRNVYIEWTAGYATVPANIEQAATALVAWMFNYSKLNTALTGETRREYSWTADGDAREGMATVLEQYLGSKADILA